MEERDKISSLKRAGSMRFRGRRGSAEHSRHARSTFAYDGFTAHDPDHPKKQKHTVLEKIPLFHHADDRSKSSSAQNVFKNTNMLSRIQSAAVEHKTSKRITQSAKKNSYIFLLDEDSNLEKASFRLRLRRYLATSPAGFALDMLNCFLSVLSCLLYVAETYSSDDDSIAFNILDLTLCAFFIFDYSIRVFIADARWYFVTSVYAVIDVLSILPTVFLLFFWLNSEASINAEAPLYLNVMKVLRVLRILRLERFLTYFESETSQVVGAIVLHGISAAFFSAGLLFVVENRWREERWLVALPFHDYWYFILASISTVGYGDISPESNFAKLYITSLVLLFLYYIPKSTNKLIRLMSMKSVYATDRYKPIPQCRHVVVTGDLASLDEDFFRELFHVDHGDNQIEAVVLGEGNPNQELEGMLKSQKYGFALTYLDGSCLSQRDLQRACCASAHACFVLANKFCSDSDEMDASTILRALSIKRYVKQQTDEDLMVCVQLMRPENKMHYAACGQIAEHELNHADDQVVCIDEIKMTLLAKTCLCPGMTALVCNLITSDEDVSDDVLSDETPKWFEEYRHGCGYEIYRTKISPVFSGLPFSTVSHLVYNVVGSLLFALEIGSATRPRIILNPGGMKIPDVDEYNIHGFCIAQDKAAAEVLSSDSLEAAVHDFSEGNVSRKSSVKGKMPRRKQTARVIPLSSNAGVESHPSFRPVSQELAERITEAREKAKKGASGHSGSLLRKVASRSNFLSLDLVGGVEHTEEHHETIPKPHAGKRHRRKSTSAWTSLLPSANKERRRSTVRTLSSVLKRNASFGFRKYFLSEGEYKLDEVTIDTSISKEAPAIKGHVVITGSVTNLQYFVRTLRSRHLGHFEPIVILNPEPIPPAVWTKVSKFPHIFFVKGSPLEQIDLERAGIDVASAAVILAKSRTREELIMQSLADAETIFAYQGIKRMNPDIKIITELVENSNIDFLNSDIEGFDSETTTALHFAAGSVYTSSMLDTLICQSYYNPQITNVLGQLVAGSDPRLIEEWNNSMSDHLDKIGKIEESHLFQIPVPQAFFRKTYGELFAFLLNMEEKVLPIGLFRGVWASLGQGPNGNRMPYVYTNPDSGTILDKVDHVFVLAKRLPQTLRSQKMTDVVSQYRKQRKQSTVDPKTGRLKFAELVLQKDKRGDAGALQRLETMVSGLVRRVSSMERHMKTQELKHNVDAAMKKSAHSSKRNIEHAVSSGSFKKTNSSKKVRRAVSDRVSSSKIKIDNEANFDRGVSKDTPESSEARPSRELDKEATENTAKQREESNQEAELERKKRENKEKRKAEEQERIIERPAMPHFPLTKQISDYSGSVRNISDLDQLEYDLDEIVSSLPPANNVYTQIAKRALEGQMDL